MNEIVDRDRLLMLDDRELGELCQFEFVKGTGAGGQHRNRTCTAVRVRHTATGLTASDCTERSQLRNRTEALRKLRFRFALEYRREPQPLPRAECAVTHADYPLWCARLLDHLAAAGFRVRSGSVYLSQTEAVYRFLPDGVQSYVPPGSAVQDEPALQDEPLPGDEPALPEE